MVVLFEGYEPQWDELRETNVVFRKKLELRSFRCRAVTQHSQHVLLFDIIAKNIILFYVQKKIVYLVPYASYPGGTGDVDPP